MYLLGYRKTQQLLVFQNAVQYYGYSEADLKAGDFTSKLTDQQMMSAYRLGQSARKIDIDSQERVRKQMRTAEQLEPAGIDTSREVSYHKENTNEQDAADSQEAMATNQSKQEVKGNERREETREAFLGRAGESLLEVDERGTLAFGYRRYKGKLSKNVRAAEEGLRNIGIPVVVFEHLEGNKNGITTIYNNDATAVPGVGVFIHKDATVDATEIIGHEGFHFLAILKARQTFQVSTHILDTPHTFAPKGQQS